MFIFSLAQEEDNVFFKQVQTSNEQQLGLRIRDLKSTWCSDQGQLLNSWWFLMYIRNLSKMSFCVALKRNLSDKRWTWQVVSLVLGVMHKWSKWDLSTDILVLVSMWYERTGEQTSGNGCEQVKLTFLEVFVEKCHLLLHQVLHWVL